MLIDGENLNFNNNNFNLSISLLIFDYNYFGCSKWNFEDIQYFGW